MTLYWIDNAIESNASEKAVKAKEENKWSVWD